MKVRHKLLIWFLAAAVAASALAGIGASQILRSAVQDRFLERIGAESAALGWVVSANPGDADLQDIAISAGSRLGYRVTLIAPDGRVLGDTSQDDAGLRAMDNHIRRPEVVDALREGKGQSRRSSATTGEEYYYHAYRVENPTDVAIVRIALPTREVGKVQSRYVRMVVPATLATLLVLSGVGYAGVRRLSRPLEKMSAAAEKTAAGDLEMTVPVKGRDEIGRLGESVNRMKSTLVSKIEDLESERRLLSTVVAGIKAGLLLLDADGRVKMTNEAFRETFGVEQEPSGKLLAEVVRHPSVIDHLDEARESGREIRDLSVDIPETGQTFELSCTHIKGEGESSDSGVLALFFDITRLESLEKIRTEFVANVSHELRTPLTSIRAFVETLAGGGIEDEENRGRFLQVIQRQTEYMGDLIGDLTELSRIETGATGLEPTPLDAGEITNEVIACIRDKYPEAGVDIASDIPEGLTVMADRRRMEQILLNLLDNAVKFNRPGGTVRIETRKVGNKIRLSVSDTGTGIPSDALDQVFHRFYRVDRARSKDVPGTGLGLAVVKHLMRLHGGTVSVKSELGIGSTFTLEFPA